MSPVPFRILATARSFCATPGLHHTYLTDNGCTLVLDPPKTLYTADELADRLAGYDAVILGLDPCDESVFVRVPTLKTVARYGVGVDNVDLPAAARHGIVVTNTPATNNIAVAELAIGLLFALARHIPAMTTAARAGAWSRVTGWELAGSTLGVIGYGAVGREVAKRGTGLGMRVLAYDPVYAGDWGAAQPVDLPTLIAQSKVISLHCPLTPDTANLIDAARIAHMQPGTVIVNTARGGLIDEAALYDALVAGHLGGAALDVFATEPPTASPLLTLDTVIATPHAGASTIEAVARAGLLAARNCLTVLRGEPCACIVTPAQN